MKKDSFKDFVMDQLSEAGPVQCRAMFGGYGLYRSGAFFGIIFKGRLYFKVSGQSRPQYVRAGMQMFKPNGKMTLKSFYEVPEEILESPPLIGDWSRAAISAAVHAKAGNAKQGRCWPTGDDELMNLYHDREWGRPVHDDSRHFEYLVLDAFQAGLSWRTVLRKRENFRKAFNGFDPKRIAGYEGKKVRELLKDAGIIRNRLKILGTIKNAKAFLQVQKEFGSFDKYIWRFTNFKPIQNRWKTIRDLPARTKGSDAMSEDLKKRGFTFVGSTICYAYMQAAGLVNDHLSGCPYRKAGN